MQSQSKKSVIAPSTYFIAQIEDWLALSCPVGFDTPNLASVLPREKRSIWKEFGSNHSAERSPELFDDKSRGRGGKCRSRHGHCETKSDRPEHL